MADRNPKAVAAMKKIMSPEEAQETPEPKTSFAEPSKKRPDMSSNLGKFLHPKSSPASNGSKDPNAAGSKVRAGY